MFTVDPFYEQTIHAPITMHELWLTLRPTRATTLGPDGMSNNYLKNLWDIIGPIILDAWQHSLRTGTLPPSHQRSILRLIPKAGKDRTEIKNWWPITLSNCDHKLITRLYNNCILAAIRNHVTTTQTAYIRGRNISDNLRLFASSVNLTNCH
jgi:hypothetical protein